MKTTHERWQEHIATLEDIKPLVNGMTADEPGALLLKLLVIIADTVLNDMPNEPVTIRTQGVVNNESI
jgi:hypothetical protein